MAAIRDVEQTEAFQTARELVNAVYQCTREWKFAQDLALVNQIRRAAISIMSNIAEGFERDGNQELAQFLSIAKGSTGEVRAQLIIALDQKYVSPAEYDRVRALASSVKRQLAGWMKYIREGEHNGVKFVKRK